MSESRLEGRVCLVTGGANGMGRATAIEMAREGASAVVLGDVKDGDGAETVELVEREGAACVYVHADLRVEADVARLVATAVERFGGLDVLHNNAAVHEVAIAGPQPVDTISNELWDLVYETNVRGTFWCTKHAAPHLRRSRAGAIVNAGSTAGLIGYPGSPAYCAAKGAILQLTRASAVDLAPVRCNAYCPAGVETPLLDQFLAGVDDPAAIRAQLVDNYLVKRLGEPEDIAHLVVFLASEHASWLTGAVISIDGGALSWRAL